MLHSLAARALLMVAQGVRTLDAIEWVIRRIPENLKRYWRGLMVRELLAALA